MESRSTLLRFVYWFCVNEEQEYFVEVCLLVLCKWRAGVLCAVEMV